MVKTILSTTRTDGTTGVTLSGIQYFWWLGYASILPDATEANREITYRAAGTISKLYVRVIGFTGSAGNDVIVRKNGSDTALKVTCTGGTTGVYENTSDTVSVSAGDKLCFRTPAVSGSTLTFAIMSVIFDSTTNCNVRYITEGYGITTASATHFLPICGNRSGTTTGEANTENTVKTAGSLKNSLAYVSSNARTNNTTFTVRKNRADTAIVFTYGSTATGLQEDTSNSVSFAVDDELDWELTTLSGTNNLTLQMLACSYETTTNDGVLTRGNVGSTADIVQNANLTRYYTLGGGAIEGVTTEADSQMKARETFTFNNLIFYSGANTVTASSTFVLRVNSSDSALTLSIGSSATGFIADTTHTVTVAASDPISFKLLTGATGTSMTARQFGITTELAAAGNNITKSLATETVSISEASLARLGVKNRAPSTETVSKGESNTRVATKQRPITIQTITLGESIVRVKGKQKALTTETISISENLAILRNKIRTISQTVTKAENITRLAAKNRTLATQTTNLSENLARIKSALRALAIQTIAVGESVGRLTAKTRARNETIVIAENRARLKGAMRLLAIQTITVGDTLARIKASLRALSDTLPKSESLNRLAVKIRTLGTQVIAIADLTQQEVTAAAGELARQITQTITIAETIGRLVTKTRTPALQTTITGESLARLKGINKALVIQTTAISESITRLLAKQRLIIQTLTIVENIARRTTKTRTIPIQTITFADSLANQVNVLIKHVVRTLSETVLIGEQLLKLIERWRATKQRRIVDVSRPHDQKRTFRSNHPAYLLGTKGMHDHYEQY